MVADGRSMEKLFSEQELLAGLLCKAFSRHLFMGNIWQETYNGVTEWREDFECEWCMTKRTRPLEPQTAIPIGSAQYRYTRDYDKTKTNDDCRRIVFTRLFEISQKGAKRAVRV